MKEKLLTGMKMGTTPSSEPSIEPYVDHDIRCEERKINPLNCVHFEDEDRAVNGNKSKKNRR